MTPRIALVYPASVPWFARCLDGVRRYAREHGGWHLFSSPPTLTGAAESALTLHSMRGWKGDGILAATSDEAELRSARKMGFPVVNLAGSSPKSFGVPRVMVNHFQAGQMAADHLLSRGLRHLAFFGWMELWYSEQRCAGFCERAAEAGVKVEILLQNPSAEARKNWSQRVGAPARWLARLPLPLGVFAAHDYRAQLVMEACHEARLRVPDDVGVIGMDNDETICKHTVPTLTSVSRNSERVGWEAAALLDRLMRGDSPPKEDLLIEPDGVVARQSTDMLYCADPVVQQTLDYMRRNLKEQFNVLTLAEHAGVAKRTLELRFRKSLGASPHELLTKLRMQHAQALMAMPQKRTVEQIAVECGLNTHTFHETFRRTTGQTPASYRRQHTASTKPHRER
jgi:LacI family transcriptional regulator